MAGIKNYDLVDVDLLIPYVNNAKKHSEAQVTKIAASIREFGFLSPCVIDERFNVIAGHGRILAAKKLGLKQVPCVFAEGLTEAQRKAYILADNRLGELATWDGEILAAELDALEDMDFSVDLTGFELNEDWFERDKEGNRREEGNDEYNAFLDKFERKKTTDDCYTPDLVYQAVAEWVAQEYGLRESDFVRPFYPGGNYQGEKYKATDVVVDNPPFSILQEIVEFYIAHGVKFFLFAPTLTLFRKTLGVCHLPVDAKVTYENGAVVNTSFLTNLETVRVRSAPTLYRAVDEANTRNQREGKVDLPVYNYPDHVITSAMVKTYSRYGVDFSLTDTETEFVRELDAQKEEGKAIYGGAFLISDAAAKRRREADERAAAERRREESQEIEQNATTWTLSERELKIVRSLK